MADTKLGEIAVYEDDDGKAVWEFEGKVQSDIPLDTKAQDFAGAINELKKLSEERGGEDHTKPWTRPSDWPVLPAPKDNQVIFLVTTIMSSMPWGSIQTRPLDQYAFPENNGEYPEDLTISVDWGDGNTSTGIYKTTGLMEWKNSHGQIGPSAENPSTTNSAENQYFDYGEDYKRFWNSGGTMLDDGSMVFIVTVTVSDPQNVVIQFPNGSYTLEMHIGRNINIDAISSYKELLQHVKAFGWQPSKNKNKRYRSYNQNTGVITWDTHGLFTNAWGLRKIDATEPFTEIPENMCGYTALIEIDLSEAEKIGDGAFQCTIFLTDTLELSKCTEIGDYAFQQALGYTRLNAPMLITVGNKAFTYCYSIREINAENLENISAEAFSCCCALIYANMPNLKIVMTRGFNNCYALTEINAPLLEAVGDYAFVYCYSLDRLDAPNLSSVGSYALQGCFSLKEFICAEGTDLSKAGLNNSYLWYDNPVLSGYRPENIT